MQHSYNTRVTLVFREAWILLKEADPSLKNTRTFNPFHTSDTIECNWRFEHKTDMCIVEEIKTIFNRIYRIYHIYIMTTDCFFLLNCFLIKYADYLPLREWRNYYFAKLRHCHGWSYTHSYFNPLEKWDFYHQNYSIRTTKCFIKKFW